MPYRKEELSNNQIYHVYSKSIAGYTIFNSGKDYARFSELMQYYSSEKPPYKFSLFKELTDAGALINIHDRLTEILAYCIMPTHIHLILKQVKDNGISIFIKRILQSYSLFFNNKYKRKGPLWEGRFKNVLVKDDDQLLHLTRYIHLNPVSSSLVESPLDWEYSSYKEYLETNSSCNICTFRNYLDITGDNYKKFVEERIDYQRKLHLIKHLTLE